MSSGLAVQPERGSEPLIALMGCDGVLVGGGVAVVEGVVVWLVCPYGLAGGLHRWRGLGVAVVEGRGVWLACPAPPRSCPARIASLARAPFAVRKGRGWCWFSGSAGKGCVGGLVGRAGLKPAPTSGGLHRWTGMSGAVVGVAWPRSALGILRERRFADKRTLQRGEGAGWEAHTNAGFGRLRYSPEPMASVCREE